MRRVLLALVLLLWAHLAFAAAPTLISYNEATTGGSFTAGAATKTTASISWNSGDVIVVISGSSSIELPNAPSTTGTGLAFTTNKSNNAAGSCAGRLSTAVASATSSGTISVTTGESSHHWGFAVWVWRSSTGVGSTAEKHDTTKTVAMTPVGANAGVSWAIFDWNADGAFTNGSPAPTNTRQNADDGTNYSYGVFDIADTAATSYGATGGGTTGPFTILVAEVKNDGGGGAASPHQLLTLGMGE